MTSPTGAKSEPNNRAAFTPTPKSLVWGFTLIELVLVTLLVMVLAGLVSPLFKKTFRNLEAQNAASNLAKMINYGQEMAVIEKRNYRLDIDYERGGYYLMKWDEAAPSGAAYANVQGRYGRTFYIPDRFKMTSTDSNIVFYPDGRSEEAEIRIADKDGRAHIISIRAFAMETEINEIGVE